MVNLTEKDIKKNWKSEYENAPLVSIKCMTYNQEKYIADALDSFLMQKTTFPFEVVVHDDASTDNTASIIAEYQKRFPNIIRPIYEEENQYSKGNGVINRIIDSHIRGKYVAMCEGDDYWTDKNKLQKQYDAMERNLGVDICAHAVRKINASSGKVLGIVAPERTDGIIQITAVIAGGGGFVGTNSLFYRKSAFDNVLPFRKLLEIDYTLQVQGALRGGMLYLSDCMSDYRFMSEGSWSSRYNDEDVVNSINLRWKAMTDQLDFDTDGKYHDIITKYMDLREVERLFRFRHYKDLKKYRYIVKSLDKNEQGRYFVMINFPRVYSVLKQIRDRIKS